MMRVCKAFLFGVVLLTACIAQGRDPVPVYGPARMAVEDEDLLDTTILPLGTLAVSPGKIWKVRAGDGLTPGGIPIHPEGCVTGFVQIANATTNLNMRSYSITFGPWAMHGDANEWDFQYGTDETWLRLIRDSGQAYLVYDFTIVDAMHYRFKLAWTGDRNDFPVLQVSTNLLNGYAPVDPADVTYSRPDTSHLVIDYAVPGEYVFLSFRVFAADRLSTGAYFNVPVNAEYGLSAVGSLSVTGRVESYYDEHAEETRDRYVPGSITLNGVTRTNLLTDAEILAMVDDFLAQRGILLDEPRYGFNRLTGFAEYLSFEEGLWRHQGNFDFPMTATNSTWDFQTPVPPKWNGIGLATTSHVATAISSLSNTVSDWIADVADDRDRADNALSNNIASVERRLGMVEDELEEYWCMWTSDSLPEAGTYSFPSTNWPARTVYCYINCTIDGIVLEVPDWSPDEARTLVFRIYKSASGSISFATSGGSSINSFSGTSTGVREYRFEYRSGLGWMASVLSLINVPYSIDRASRISWFDVLPEDGTFAPVVSE